MNKAGEGVRLSTPVAHARYACRLMDPITHSFVGASLAASGLRRKGPLATAALILGANAPDIDGCAYFAGPYTAFAFRRGWTHGVLAVLVLPFLVAGLLVAWDHWIRRRRRPDARPAHGGTLLALAALGVATHPLLDWLNTYGVRWLMPFDGRWFYGDALFIVDPWIWLTLGAALYLKYSQRTASVVAWSVFWLFGSMLMVGIASVPLFARLLWLAGVITVLTLRACKVAAPRHELGIERTARFAFGFLCVYIGVAVAASVVARSAVRSQLTAQGIGSIRSIMVAPSPADPFAGQVVIATDTDYYFGHWNWFPRPSFMPNGDHVARLGYGPLIEAAAKAPDVRRFLVWSRFPYVQVQSNANGQYLVHFRDARYRGTAALRGPTVRLCATSSGLKRCG